LEGALEEIVDVEEGDLREGPERLELGGIPGRFLTPAGYKIYS
jgi:hypothetical protein